MSKLEPKMHGASDLSIRDGVYYFRKRIPDDLKASYGKKNEIKFSLKTKNKKQAEILAAAERHRLLKEFAAKRKLQAEMAAGTSRTFTVVNAVDPAFIDYVCSTRLRNTLENDDEFRPLFGPDWRELVRPAEHDKDFFPLLKKALANGDTEWIRPLLEAHLQVMGIQLECSKSDYRTLTLLYQRGVVIGAAVLFPHPSEDDYSGHRFHKSLDQVEIGGIPLLPNSTSMLQAKIDQLLAREYPPNGLPT